MKNKLAITITFIFMCLITSQAFALTFRLPSNGDNIVGHMRHVQSLPGDTFNSIGRRFDIGYYEMVEANPGINPHSIPTGTKITVPTKFILPPVEHANIVVNIAELRLYYYPPNKKVVITYPVGIGSEGKDTPVGKTKVIKKVRNPTWVVPKSILEERAEDGVILPKSIAPGPDNPLGGYALYLQPYLGFSGYRIHGAKREDIEGIGRRSSHGCIRMFPEDIERLFEEVHAGITVHILNSPNKIGWSKGRLYLEAHLPLEASLPNYHRDTGAAFNLIKTVTKVKPAAINWNLAKDAANDQHGYPEIIGIMVENRNR